MCGIVYVKRLDGKYACKMVSKRYHNQKKRGQQGFGFVSLKNGEIQKYARREEEKDIIRILDLEFSDEILFHHRLPTSTANVREAAHPIKVSHPMLKYDYFVVHNGIIHNDTELKKEHEVLGFEYNTELTTTIKSRTQEIIAQSSEWNDSEALAIEMAIAIESGLDKIGTRGPIACICLQTKKNSTKATRLFFGRNFGNPLRAKFDETYISLTSEGDGELVEVDKLFSFDYRTLTVEGRDFKFGNSYTYSGRNSYRDEDYRYNRGTELPLPSVGSGDVKSSITTTLWPEKEPAGFKTIASVVPSYVQKEERRLSVIAAQETEIMDEEEETERYIDLSLEYEAIEKKIADSVDKTTPDVLKMEERKTEIKKELQDYDERKLERALAQGD